MTRALNRSLSVVRSGPALSRFDQHRQHIAERVTLELASQMARSAAENAAKAASLMGTASALPDRRKPLRDDWMRALASAYNDLGEIIKEMES
jgi:hypothetical protein